MTYNSMFYSLLTETCCFKLVFNKNKQEPKKENEKQDESEVVWENFITLWVCVLKQNVSLNDKRCLFLSIKSDSIWLIVIMSVFLLVVCLTLE